MCGIFGAVSLTGAEINAALLRRMAIEVETRGRHAHGLAWVTHGGYLRQYKAPGPISTALDIVGGAADSQAVIGHCRYMTQGDPAVNDNNHPHATRGGLIVHNGRVENYEALVTARRLRTRTECDTEAIALLIDRYRGSTLQRVERAVQAVDGSMALLGLWDGPLRLVVVRRGRPLYGCAWDGVWYFASLPWALPRWRRIRNNTARVIRFRRGSIEQTIRDIRPAGHEEPEPRRRCVAPEYRDAPACEYRRPDYLRVWGA